MSPRAFGLIVFSFGLILISSSADIPAFAQQHATSSGSAIFSASCGACHGSDGRGGEQAPNIATRNDVVLLSDAELVHIVENGIPGTGMPAFSYLGNDRVRSVVQYLRTLQGIGGTKTIRGDPGMGESLFYGKAACAKCHMVDGQGGFLGSDLTGYGHGRTADAIRDAIVEPDSNPDPASRQATVITNKGAKLTGLIRARNNFFVVLQTEDGAFHSFGRGEIARLNISKHSLMPQSYGTDLDSKELNDLIAYLSTAGATKETSQ